MYTQYVCSWNIHDSTLLCHNQHFCDYFYQDRLEQSHATNRSMQNYVQFLKSSYASVMGDISTTSPISPVRASSSLREGGASLRQPHFWCDIAVWAEAKSLSVQNIFVINEQWSYLFLFPQDNFAIFISFIITVTTENSHETMHCSPALR